MKNIRLSFRAQRLDNTGPDHMEVGRHLLSEGSIVERQKFAQDISRISIHDSQVFSDRYHSAFLLNGKFLLKTPSDQLDNADRVATIITYGSVPDDVPQNWPNDVVAELTGFAGRIGRTICKENREVAQCAMQFVVEKECLRRQCFRSAKLIGFGLIIACVIYWLVFNKN